MGGERRGALGLLFVNLSAYESLECFDNNLVMRGPKRNRKRNRL